MGAVAVSEAIPEGATEVELFLRTGCHPDVPGWSGRSTTDLSATELEAWYSERFGPLNGALSDRHKAASIDPDGPQRFLIFDDVRVVFTPPKTEGEALRFFVSTYETTGHECPPRSAELWDKGPVTAYTETERSCLDFLGVEYRPLGITEAPAVDARPPEDWTHMTYESGRVIAYSWAQPRVVYAGVSGDDTWQRHAGRCFNQD